MSNANEGQLDVLVSTLRCHHGNIIYAGQRSGKCVQFRAGLPKCCLDEMRKPASGDGFIIVERDGRQKRIHHGIFGASLIGANTKDQHHE
jgi:hypothetical protein